MIQLDDDVDDKEILEENNVVRVNDSGTPGSALLTENRLFTQPPEEEK
mgnify:CR=1 FL=1